MRHGFSSVQPHIRHFPGSSFGPHPRTTTTLKSLTRVGAACTAYTLAMNRKSVKVGPTPGDRFEMRLFVLNQEVLFARFHLQIARGLAQTAEEKTGLLEVAPQFFGLTFRAHTESAYSRAAKLFDRRAGTATIRGLLDAADKKAGTFQFATAVEVRKNIDVWRGQIASIEPQVAKLSDLRNALMAHFDEKIIFDADAMKRTVNVTFDEVERILEAAKEIVDSALDAYNRSIYIDKLLSADDYKKLVAIIEKSSKPGSE